MSLPPKKSDDTIFAFKKNELVMHRQLPRRCLRSAGCNTSTLNTFDGILIRGAGLPEDDTDYDECFKMGQSGQSAVLWAMISAVVPGFLQLQLSELVQHWMDGWHISSN